MSNRRAKLVIYRDNAFDRECWLNTSIVTIGRAPDNVLCLSEDLSISRHHAQVAVSTMDYMITDVGSSDGTYVNSDRLQPFTPSRLKEGDQIQIGNIFKITFQLADVSISEPGKTRGPVEKEQNPRGNRRGYSYAGEKPSVLVGRRPMIW
jgi:pSer/pThr/pTyr-binding forkhead associated (FHA) protein